MTPTAANGMAQTHRRLTAWGAALVWQATAGLAVCVAATIASGVHGGYFWARWVWFGVVLTLAAQLAVRRAWQAPTSRERGFALHLWGTVVLEPVEVAIWALSGGGPFWPVWPIAGLAGALGVHAVIRHSRRSIREQELAERVDTLTRTRRGAVDVQAAELKRIERDLHDGTQARMVSLAMNLGLAEQLVKRDPDGAAELMAEARHSTLIALDELRTVMRGIQPPVLNDRGLVGAIEALALDLSVPTTVIATLPGRPPAPVESAIYLAVAECLANVVKHSRANSAWVALRYDSGMLSVTVGDDGTGGASLAAGTGLAGVARRLEVFDGTVDVHSPAGGPTEVIMELPCELSSQKTSSSSETD